jgi:hypothetical protein
MRNTQETARDQCDRLFTALAGKAVLAVPLRIGAHAA